MNEVKGIAEVLEHLLYEVVGLLIPGALLGAALAWLHGTEELLGLIRFAGTYPWLCAGAAYVLGYPIQGVSRPVTALAEWILRLPGRIGVGLLLWALPQGPEERLARRLERLETWLAGRHAHPQADPDAPDLSGVAERYWMQRLGLAEGQRLGSRQVQDLCFSAIAAERRVLDRFRAAASMARATAAVVAITAVGLWWNLLSQGHAAAGHFAPLMIGLVVTFYGLLRRADLYHSLWGEVLRAQFLQIATERPASQS